MAVDVQVYTVNGATAGSSSSLPDWLTRKRATGGGKKRTRKEHYEGTIQLIQGFEFPEASNKVRTTRDGTHVIATGTYKPQIRVWNLDQLSLKFERHTDAENVDFCVRKSCSVSMSYSPNRKNYSYYLTTGRNRYIFKMTEASNYTLKVASITVLEYLDSVAR